MIKLFRPYELSELINLGQLWGKSCAHFLQPHLAMGVGWEDDKRAAVTYGLEPLPSRNAGGPTWAAKVILWSYCAELCWIPVVTTLEADRCCLLRAGRVFTGKAKKVQPLRVSIITFTSERIQEGFKDANWDRCLCRWKVKTPLCLKSIKFTLVYL